MTWDVCRCGHGLQSHHDPDLNAIPCRLPACRCAVFVSEDEPVQLGLAAADASLNADDDGA